MRDAAGRAAGGDRAGAHRPRGPRRRRPLADDRDAQPHRRPAGAGDRSPSGPTRRWPGPRSVGRESLDSIRQVMGLLREPGCGDRRCRSRVWSHLPASSTATAAPACPSPSTSTSGSSTSGSTRPSSSSSTASCRSRWPTCCSTRRVRRPPCEIAGDARRSCASTSAHRPHRRRRRPRSARDRTRRARDDRTGAGRRWRRSTPGPTATAAGWSSATMPCRAARTGVPPRPT